MEDPEFAPHAVQPVRCDACEVSWVAVAPALCVGPFECPCCRRMTGEIEDCDDDGL